MAVWGHHLFASGQEVNDYFSLTSILLSVPAGIEYFGFLGTLLGGKLRYTTSMLFALAFIPQFRQRDPLRRRRAAGLARAWPSGSGSPSWRRSR
jgi:Cytochrome C and Quinol oxidase polypeptide I